MNLWHIILLMFVHWVADFVLQTDAMAKGKSSDSVVLLRHILAYTLAMAVPLVFIAPSVYAFWMFLVINFVAHFWTDFATSRLTTYFWLREERHNFFVTIGFDQFLHAAVLLWSYNYLLV